MTEVEHIDQLVFFEDLEGEEDVGVRDSTSKLNQGGGGLGIWEG